MREQVFFRSRRAKVASRLSTFDGWPVRTSRVTAAYIRPSRLGYLGLGTALLGAVWCMAPALLHVAWGPEAVTFSLVGGALVVFGMRYYLRVRSTRFHLVMPGPQGEVILIKNDSRPELEKVLQALREANAHRDRPSSVVASQPPPTLAASGAPAMG